jgi:5'-nucleotidase
MSKNWNLSKSSVPGALIILIATAAAGLVACSDNSATSTKLTINGTAATGAPMANAKVTVLCASDKFPGQIKQGIATTATDGSYSVVVNDGIAPCVIEADNGVIKLHSLVDADMAGTGSRGATANITPITEMIFAGAADSADTAAFFTGFNSDKVASMSRANVNLAKQAVMDNLKLIGLTDADLVGITDPIGGALVPKIGSQAGNAYDKVLDALAANKLTDTSNTTPVSVKIMAINDFHGNFKPPSSTNGGTVVLANGASTKSVTAGGAAYMATLLKQMRAKANGANNILVGAGDLIGASPYESSVTNDEASVDILNALGLEVSSVGNHEFDRGIAELKRIQNGGCRSAASGGVVGTNTCLQTGNVYSGAKYKYLAANVVDTASGATALPATYIKRFGTVSVGFVGLVLKGTPNSVSASGVAGLRFDDEAAVINRYANTLKASGVTSVVVLIHQGGQTTSSTINDKTCPGFSGDIIPILNQLNKNVDVVVSGHTHMEYVCNFASTSAGKNILVTSTGFYGNAVSEIDLVLQPGKGLIGSSANTVPVIQNIPGNSGLPSGFTALDKDPTVDALVTNYSSKAAIAGALQVGSITGDIKRATYVLSGSTTRDETNESPLGDLMADSYLAAAPMGADIAFVNPGSVRADLLFTNSGRANGVVTLADLATIEPFGNTLYTTTLTGAQIIRLLEQQWESPNHTAKTNPGTNTVGRILCISKGFTYSYDNNAAYGAASGQGNRLVAGSVKLNGIAIDNAKSYKIITNSYLAILNPTAPLGPDNFTILTKGTNNLDTKILDLDAFIAYFSANPGLSAPAARITRVN